MYALLQHLLRWIAQTRPDPVASQRGSELYGKSAVLLRLDDCGGRTLSNRIEPNPDQEHPLAQSPQPMADHV